MDSIQAKTFTLSEKEIRQLSSLLKLCLEDDLLDLQSYDSISRADRISEAWKALDVLKSITN